MVFVKTKLFAWSILSIYEVSMLHVPCVWLLFLSKFSDDLGTCWWTSIFRIFFNVIHIQIFKLQIRLCGAFSTTDLNFLNNRNELVIRLRIVWSVFLFSLFQFVQGLSKLKKEKKTRPWHDYGLNSIRLLLSMNFATSLWMRVALCSWRILRRCYHLRSPLLLRRIEAWILF